MDKLSDLSSFCETISLVYDILIDLIENSIRD